MSKTKVDSIHLPTAMAHLMGFALCLIPFTFANVIVETPRPTNFTITPFLVDEMFYLPYIPIAIMLIAILVNLKFQSIQIRQYWSFIPLILVWAGHFYSIEVALFRPTTFWSSWIFGLCILFALAAFWIRFENNELLFIVWFLIGCTIQAIIAILQSVQGGPIGLNWLGEIQYRPELVFGIPDESYRSTGLTYNPNILGGVLVTGVILTVYAHSKVKSNLQRVLVGFSAVVIAWGLLSTQSRTAFLGALVFIISLLGRWFVHRLHGAKSWRSQLPIVGGMVIVITILMISIMVLPVPIFQRVTTILANPLSHLDRIFYAIPESYKLIAARPLRGFGSNMGMLALVEFHRNASFLIPAHNVFVWMAVELGMPIVGIWSLALILGLIPFVYVFRADNVVLASGTLTLSTMMLFDHYFYLDNRMTLLVMVLLGMSYASRSSTPTAR